MSLGQQEAHQPGQSRQRGKVWYGVKGAYCPLPLSHPWAGPPCIMTARGVGRLWRCTGRERPAGAGPGLCWSPRHSTLPAQGFRLCCGLCWTSSHTTICLFIKSLLQGGHPTFPDPSPPATGASMLPTVALRPPITSDLFLVFLLYPPASLGLCEAGAKSW